MSEENLEIVREVYSEPLPLDPDLLIGLAEFATPDTLFDFTDAYPDGPVVRGVAGVRRIATTWPWKALYFTPERFLDVDGQRVLVFVRATATGMGSGVPVERRTAHECTFSDGVLVRFKVYSDRGAALEASGLSDRPATRLPWVEHSA
jgi:ketosteroid isomerase-like protein